MEVNATKIVKVNAKTLSIHMKCRDTFECQILDQDGEVIKVYEGYVPSFLPGNHGGDYLTLDIDLDTGQITNWNEPTASEIEEFIRDGE